MLVFSTGWAVFQVFCLPYWIFRNLWGRPSAPCFTAEDALWGLETPTSHTHDHKSASGTQVCPRPSALSVTTLCQFGKGQHVLRNAQQATWSLWDQVGEWVAVGTVPRAATCQMRQTTCVDPWIVSPRSSNREEQEKSSKQVLECSLY